MDSKKCEHKGYHAVNAHRLHDNTCGHVHATQREVILCSRNTEITRMREGKSHIFTGYHVRCVRCNEKF